MKLLVVEKLGANAKLPLTSSHLLAQNLIYSLVGYRHFNDDVTILRDGEGILPKSEVYKVENYDVDHYEDKIKELSKNRYDGVMVFDAELVTRSVDLPISNLIWCCSESEPFISPELKAALELPWIKVISFLPSLSEIQGMKVTRLCTPAVHYESDTEVELEEHSRHTIMIPIDFRVVGPELNDVINTTLGLCKKSYPNSDIILGFIGIQIREENPDAGPMGVTPKSYNHLGEYLADLIKCDLQVSYKVPYSLDLYPFLSMEFGVPFALVTGPAFKKDYPYLEDDYTEILGVNSIEMEATRSSDPSYGNYLKNLAKSYDEIRFNLQFHQALNGIINLDYREQYRVPFTERMEELRRFREEHPEKLKLKEHSNVQGDNKLQESEVGTGREEDSSSGSGN